MFFLHLLLPSNFSFSLFLFFRLNLIPMLLPQLPSRSSFELCGAIYLLIYLFGVKPQNEPQKRICVDC